MAWIYHNATLWLISLSSDGSNWITIADKNLWATEIYNGSETINNVWGLFQWGNNYMWWANEVPSTSTSQINASTYWPWNYYTNSTWRTAMPRDSSNNTNLRWWVTWTVEATKWPCDVWFHIPTDTEWNRVISIFNSLEISTVSNYKTYLKLPLLRWRWPDTSVGTNVPKYWTCTRNGNYWYFLNLADTISVAITSISSWLTIRPFANTSVVPDYNDTWTTLYWDELPDRPQVPKLKRLQKWWNYYYFKDAPTHASGITLNKSSINLTSAWQTEQLVATITPSDAIDKRITWTSSNEAVARVSSNWLVTCVTPGSATITATTNDWWLTATCNVIMVRNISYHIVWWWWGWAGSSNLVWWSWWWWGGYSKTNRSMEWSCLNVCIWSWWSWWIYQSNWNDWWNSWIYEYSNWTQIWCDIASWWKWWIYNNYICSWCNTWWNSWNWNLWWMWAAIQNGWWWWWAWAWWNWCWQDNLTLLCYIAWQWWAWARWYWGWGWGWGWCQRSWSMSPDYCDWAAWWSWWWWAWWGYWSNWCPATSCWGWWWWAWAARLSWWAGWWWVVIICYKSDWSCWISCATWWTVTTSWDYKVHTFTSNWTFTIVS